MKLQIKKDNVINDITTWFRYAEPEGGTSQWEKGRSAMEFARYMTTNKNTMPKEIENYLTDIGFSTARYTCYPEEVTSFANFDLGSGSGRHHDGLLVSDDYLIGIEAKVSEPFDKSISYKIEKAKKNSDGGENMRNRIFKSLKMIKPNFADESLISDEVKPLMYQLISGTVGTIIEAQNRNISKASFLIIEFAGDVKKEKKYDDRIKANEEAYENFLNFLGLSNKPDKDRYIDVVLKGNQIRIWMAKIKINIFLKNQYELEKY